MNVNKITFDSMNTDNSNNNNKKQTVEKAEQLSKTKTA